MDYFCYYVLCLLYFCACSLQPCKGLTSWFSFVMLYFVFVTSPCDIKGQVWYWIVSIPDLCHLSYNYIYILSSICFLGCGYDEISSIVKGISNIFWEYTCGPDYVARKHESTTLGVQL